MVRDATDVCRICLKKMPRDNKDTSPTILVSRARGNSARLNMELAMSERDLVDSGVAQSASASSPLSIAASEIATGTGGTGGGGRFKVDPNVEN